MRRYIKLHTVILTNDKVAALSSDAARWHYAKLLLHAKQTEPEGRWRSMSLLRSSVGEDTFAYVPEFMATLGPDGQPEGLIEQTETGEIRVRQWWYWQGSDLNARRDDLGEQQQDRKRAKERKKKAAYRAKRRAAEVRPEDDVHHPVHQMSTDVHPNRETDKSLYEDGGHVRVLPDAPVSPSDASMRVEKAPVPVAPAASAAPLPRMCTECDRPIVGRAAVNKGKVFHFPTCPPVDE